MKKKTPYPEMILPNFSRLLRVLILLAVNLLFFKPTIAQDGLITTLLLQSENLSIRLLNSHGEVVQHLLAGQQDAGRQQFEFEIPLIADGLCILQTRIGNQVYHEKILRMK